MTTHRAAHPLRRAHMPRTFDVSLARYLGQPGAFAHGAEAATRIPADHGPRQSLRGFEPTYANIIDYIVRITHRIWEDRDVHYIEQCYSHDSLVYDDYGLQHGSAKIVADTHHTTGAFSDIVLLADEVVWAGDDEVGFHTSHRTLIRGTNDAPSRYGPATGRAIDVLVIANCVALENDIFLEHVLYNSSAMLAQLGHSLPEIAERLVASAPAGWPRSDAVWTALRAAASPARPLHEAEPVAGFDVDRFERDYIDAAWNRRDTGAVAALCETDARFSGPTMRELTSPAGWLGFISSQADALHDFVAQVDEVYWMGNDDDGYLTSTRWSAEAVHAGDGSYGAPTGTAVQLWGITQHQVRAGRVVAEWTLFNELDVMMQIAAARR